MLKGKRIAVIGVGKIGEAIVTGLLKQGAVEREDIIGSVKHDDSVRRVHERLGIEVQMNSPQVAQGRDIILLAVKPQNMDSALKQLSDALNPDQLVITVAASINTAYVQERIPENIPVVRAMPNTPCVMNEGMTVLCGGIYANQGHLQIAQHIFQCIGRTVFLDESLMDGVTGLSGSGPAYMYVVIEALAEAGVKLGIPRETSTLLAAQTMYGAAKMVLESKAHPALLKDMVTTPAGCTIDGLLELEEGKLRVTLVKAVVKAAERARELVAGK